MPMQGITALLRSSPGQRDQRREVAVALAIFGQENQFQTIEGRHFAANDQLQSGLFCCLMRPHNAGQRALVGQRQRRVTLGHGLLDQLVRMRGAAQEAEIERQ
jgi:hypothetical protein